MARDISRGEYLRWITELWPDKKKIADLVADWTDSLSRSWPRASRAVFCGLLVRLGTKIEQAKSPGECNTAFFGVIDYLRCPEPGWDAADVRIVD